MYAKELKLIGEYLEVANNELVVVCLMGIVGFFLLTIVSYVLEFVEVREITS